MAHPKPSTHLLLAAFVGAAVVVIDTISKLLAGSFLEYDKTYDIMGSWFSLHLMHNTSYGGTGLVKLTRLFPNPEGLIVCLTVGYIIFAIALAVVWRLRIHPIFKVMSLVGYLTAFSIITGILAFSLGSFRPRDDFVAWFSKIGALSVAAAGFSLCVNLVPKLIWGAYIGAGLSNMISSLYPPYHVIDFIFVRFLNKAFGWGIFNFADVVASLGTMYIVFYGLYLLAVLIMRKSKPPGECSEQTP